MAAKGRDVEAGQQPAWPRVWPQEEVVVSLPTRVQLLLGCEQGSGGGVCEGGRADGPQGWGPPSHPQSPSVCARGTSAIALSSLAAEMSELLEIKSPSH